MDDRARSTRSTRQPVARRGTPSVHRRGGARPRRRRGPRGRCEETLVAVQRRRRRDADPRAVRRRRGRRDVVVAGQCELSLHRQPRPRHAAASTPTPSTGGAGTGRPCSRTSSRSPREHGRTVLDTDGRLAVRPAGGRLGRGGRRVPAAARVTASGSATCTGCSTSPWTSGLLDALAAEAAPHHTAYTVRTVGRTGARGHRRRASPTWSRRWWSRRPPATSSASPRARTSARCGARRSCSANRGAPTYNSAALDATGEVGGLLQPRATSVHDPGNAFQWGTLVRRADRGHRLGLAVKVATLRLLHAGRGACHGGCTRGTPR